jgi:hypothetical protein
MLQFHILKANETLNLPAPAFMTRKLKCWRPNYHFRLTREALAGAFARTIEFQLLADRAKLALHIFSALFSADSSLGHLWQAIGQPIYVADAPSQPSRAQPCHFPPFKNCLLCYSLVRIPITRLCNLRGTSYCCYHGLASGRLVARVLGILQSPEP